MDTQDVRMLEAPQKFEFAFERGACRRMPQPFSRQDLQRDSFIALAIMSQPDFAAPARAEPALQHESSS